jgi:hypothetical protein
MINMTNKKNKELKEILWKKRKKEIIAKKGNKCQSCGRTEYLQVHHKKQGKLSDKEYYEPKDDDVIVLCRKCHYIFHKTGKYLKPQLSFKERQEIIKEHPNSFQLPCGLYAINEYGISLPFYGCLDYCPKNRYFGNCKDFLKYQTRKGVFG